jgi:multidrug resistance efflux pump
MKKKILVILGVMVIIIAAVTYYYWFEDTHYVATEDARVDGNIIKVSPQVTGQILELPVEENMDLRQGEELGRLTDVTLSNENNVDLTVIRAPINGTIIKKIAYVGEIAAPGSPVAMMADLKDLYITANIEEGDLSKIKIGQQVDYSIDTFPGMQFKGQVISIGDAANSVFSLLPQQSSGNTFTKVTQRIPVKISIGDYQNKRLLPGMNAFIKIHLK